MRAVLGLLIWVATALAAPASTLAPESRLCLVAADRATARHGLPQSLLHAISKVETRGHPRAHMAPWPWSLNIAGQGFWYDTRAQARTAAEAALAHGQSLIDLGCFQVNFHWHGKAFGSLDDMLEPERGADYAARFLSELYRETGDWLTAVGFYHSRRQAAAERYRGLVAATMSEERGGPWQAPATTKAPFRQNLRRAVGDAFLNLARNRQPAFGRREIAPGGVALSGLRQPEPFRGSLYASPTGNDADG